MFSLSHTYTQIMTQTGKMREVEEALPHETPSKRSQHRDRERIMSINTLQNIKTFTHTSCSSKIIYKLGAFYDK